MAAKIEELNFDLAPGRTIARKYEVLEKIGAGWEGEVYKIREKRSGIERAAKLFYPHRNPGDKSVLAYARKLHKLRNCSMVVGYNTEEFIQVKGVRASILIAELVEGTILENLIQQAPRGRLSPYRALHMLYALATGMDEIHSLGEYHGDLHSENVIVLHQGLRFKLKLLDMYYWGRPTQANIRHDTVEMVRLFYDAIGGRMHYAKQPQVVKSICCGMKPSLILKKFRSAGELKYYLENIEWQE